MDKIRLFITTRAVFSIIVLCIFTFTSFESYAESYSPILTKAFKALDRYFKSCNSWDRVDFQDCITEAAESGDPEAQYQYYYFTFDKHYKGYYWPDIKLSESLAVEYLKKSSTQGNLKALGEMGILMSFGKEEWGIEKDRIKAFEYLKVARKTGNPKYILELAQMYLERADTIPSSYHEALNCFNEFQDRGGNKWKAVQGKFEIYFRTNQYNIAYPLAKQWLTEFKKQHKYDKESKYKKIDPQFVYPTYYDYFKAMEVFTVVGNPDDLNLIPIEDDYSRSYGFYYPEDKLNFRIWDDGSSYHKYKMLDMIENYYVHKNVDPDYLKGIKSLKFFYNLNKSPDKEHCFSRARYYKYIHDYDNEIRILYEGINRGDFNSMLQLALYYYYGNDYMAINKNQAFIILEDLKDWPHYHGYNRVDYAKACYLLGMLYYSNEVKGFDYKKSVEYLNKFLDNSKGTSKSIIGNVYKVLEKCYRYGRGVEVDLSKADNYSYLAVKYGNPEETEIQKWLNSISIDDSKKSSLKQ